MKKVNRLIALLLVAVMMLSSCAMLEGDSSIGGAIGEWYDDLFGENSGSENNSKEEIMIIDTSVSMQTRTYGETRLERAVNRMHVTAEEAFEAGNSVSVIIADKEAYTLVHRIGADRAYMLYEALEGLIVDDAACSYYAADISGAMELANKFAASADEAHVTLYTDTAYEYTGDVTVCNVTDISEWNAAILDVRALLVDNYYRVEIDVVSYGRDEVLDLRCVIRNANNRMSNIAIDVAAMCTDSQITTIVLGCSDTAMGLVDEEISLTAYDYIEAYICWEGSSGYEDSFEYDNSFYLYDGYRISYNVLIQTTNPESTFSYTVKEMLSEISDHLDIRIHEAVGNEPTACEGYDLYIYENCIPYSVPCDGVVLFVDPPSISDHIGITLGSTISVGEGNVFLKAVNKNELLKNVNASAISITQFTSVENYQGYDVLLTANVDRVEYPMLLHKETEDYNIIVMPFSIENFSLSQQSELSILLSNIVDYYLFNIEDSVCEVGDKLLLDARYDISIVVHNISFEFSEESMPAMFEFTTIGTYTVAWIDFSGVVHILNIFVKVPASESNIFDTKGILPYA